MKYILTALLFCSIMVIIGLLAGFPIKWLWNGLMPEIFGLKEISFWQALGLYILAALLFKNNVNKTKE